MLSVSAIISAALGSRLAALGKQPEAFGNYGIQVNCNHENRGLTHLCIQWLVPVLFECMAVTIDCALMSSIDGATTKISVHKHRGR